MRMAGAAVGRPCGLACRWVRPYFVHCSTAIGVAGLLPFLGVSSLNFGPLATAAFSWLQLSWLARTASRIYEREPRRRRHANALVSDRAGAEGNRRLCIQVSRALRLRRSL